MANEDKKPRHIVVATNHLLKQRDRALNDRRKADNQVKELEAALIALGWNEQLSLTPKDGE